MQQGEISEARYVMGTVVEITTNRFENTDRALKVIHDAFECFEKFETMFSRFDSESELSLVNTTAHIHPTAVSEPFFQIFSRAFSYSEKFPKFFSVTLGSLIDLWENCSLSSRLPSDQELNEALKLASPNLIKLDENKKTIFLKSSFSKIDFGGFIKGYAVDEAKKILKTGGITHAVINAGRSSISTISNSFDAPWCVGITLPTLEEEPVGILSLTNSALSSSATNEKQFTIQERTFSHLISPETGYPLEENRSATVICRSAAQAEVASKILIFEGCKKGIAICDQKGWNLEGSTICYNNNSKDFYIETTENFPLDSALISN